MLERIVKRMEEIGIFSENVTEESKLIDLGFNSLLLMEFLVLIEEEFDTEFDDEDMEIENFVSIKTLMDLLEQKMQ